MSFSLMRSTRPDSAIGADTPAGAERWSKAEQALTEGALNLVHSCSILFNLVQSCSILFNLVQSFSILFNLVQSCSILFSLVNLFQSCSSLEPMLLAYLTYM